VGPFGANEYLFQQIKLYSLLQLRGKVVRPMDSTGVVVRGALTAGIEHCMSINNDVPQVPPVPVATGTNQYYSATKSYLISIPIQINSSFHMESESCSGRHDPDGKDRRYDFSEVFLPKDQRHDQFKPLRFPVVQFFNHHSQMLFKHFIYASPNPMAQGDFISGLQDCKYFQRNVMSLNH